MTKLPFILPRKKNKNVLFYISGSKSNNYVLVNKPNYVLKTHLLQYYANCS